MTLTTGVGDRVEHCSFPLVHDQLNPQPQYGGTGAQLQIQPDPFGGEGNGDPLQYSCLGNPMDGGAWQAAVHGVAKSQT